MRDLLIGELRICELRFRFVVVVICCWFTVVFLVCEMALFLKLYLLGDVIAQPELLSMIFCQSDDTFANLRLCLEKGGGMCGLAILVLGL